MKILQKPNIPNNHKGLFIVDLDGTLLTSERQIAPVDLTALYRLRKEGFLIALATGRSNYSFGLLMEKLGYTDQTSRLPVDYVIFSTGAGIMDFSGNKILKSFSLSPEDVRRASEYLELSGLDYMIHRPVPDTSHFLYSHNGSINPDFHRRLEMYSDFGTLLSPEALDTFGGATEVLCIVSDETGHDVAARVKTDINQCSVIKATSPLDGKSIWIEIFAPTVSKSQAVKWLSESIGLPQSTICAVGNDYNDEDLLHWAKQSFMVANGPPSLKKLFDNVASNDDGGVSEAVDRWLVGAAR